MSNNYPYLIIRTILFVSFLRAHSKENQRLMCTIHLMNVTFPPSTRTDEHAHSSIGSRLSSLDLAKF